MDDSEDRDPGRGDREDDADRGREAERGRDSDRGREGDTYPVGVNVNVHRGEWGWRGREGSPRGSSKSMGAAAGGASGGGREAEHMKGGSSLTPRKHGFGSPAGTGLPWGPGGSRQGEFVAADASPRAWGGDRDRDRDRDRDSGREGERERTWDIELERGREREGERVKDRDRQRERGCEKEKGGDRLKGTDLEEGELEEHRRSVTPPSSNWGPGFLTSPNVSRSRSTQGEAGLGRDHAVERERERDRHWDREMDRESGSGKERGRGG